MGWTTIVSTYRFVSSSTATSTSQIASPPALPNSILNGNESGSPDAWFVGDQTQKSSVNHSRVSSAENTPYPLAAKSCCICRPRRHSFAFLSFCNKPGAIRVMFRSSSGHGTHARSIDDSQDSEECSQVYLASVCSDTRVYSSLLKYRQGFLGHH